MTSPRLASQQIRLLPAADGWWRAAVIYQIYPRSWSDANGDGTGDLPGITARLPVLRDLGVDALWISPFYPSPQADGGYDVADYHDVDPVFGSLDDADALIATAHHLGLRIFVDIVPNHTSDEHPWFQQALAAGPGSPEHARYWFLDSGGPPNNWPSDFGGPAWTQVPDGQWYLHMFDRRQPDLNWNNPEVRQMFTGVLRFWLDRGVDGFRVDVARQDPAFRRTHGEVIGRDGCRVPIPWEAGKPAFGFGPGTGSGNSCPSRPGTANWPSTVRTVSPARPSSCGRPNGLGACLPAVACPGSADRP